MRSSTSIYTMCNLTKSGDKLIACAGLAKRIAAVSNGEYLADLLGAITWSINSCGRSPRMPFPVDAR